MTRSEQLYAVAVSMKFAARSCGRGAAAAALTVTAAAAAHAAGGMALALAIVGVLLIRRIAFGRLERAVRGQAFGAELWESFQNSNWRERTGWAQVA
jgi:hypothetical protein